MAALVVACGSSVRAPSATPSPASTSSPSGTTSPEARPTDPASSTPTSTVTPSAVLRFETQRFAVPSGAGPHDVAPAADGGVWYTAQRQGALGYLDPKSGKTRQIALGAGSAPHGVIVGADGAAWVTDGGLNAIVRVDPKTDAVTVYRLPASRGGANLNTATFDKRGRVWFTGQSGIYGVLDPATKEIRVFDAPRGAGPYGITTTPDGTVWYASLANSYVGRIDVESGRVEVIDPPTKAQGARRVWSDAQGRVWVSEWTAGQVAVYDPAGRSWAERKLPGSSPQAYAVYVDERGAVWLSDFAANALVRYDPATTEFKSFPLEGRPGNIRQIHGRPGEVWGAESATDHIVVVRTLSSG
ncbi:MAG: lyase [Dehalococcoidia bacterium]|nr:MAG: lyase [Dehalococcoidia bacterium]